MDGEVVLIKLGGSVITNKAEPFTTRADVITRLATEIHSSRAKTGVRLIVGHGGGSYPHVPATKYSTHLGIIDEKSSLGAAFVQDAASRLNRIVVDALIRAGEPAVSVQPSSGVVAKDSKIINWDLDALELMLNIGLLPVPYGDLGMDCFKGICILSTEEIFRYLSTKLKLSRVIVGTNVDGVYDKDPKNKDAQKIPLITLENVSKVLPSLGGADTVDVTGGMRTKVLTLLDLVKGVNVECEVLNILIPGALEKALNGEKGRGTLIRRK